MALMRLLAGVAGLAPLAAQTLAIEVFTTDDWPVTVPPDRSVTVVHLDEPLQLEAELGRELGTDPEQARERVLARVNTPRGRELLAAIPQAYARALRAVELGVSRLPAVVFDGRYVVYGVPDVAQAEALYRQHPADARP